MGQACTKGGFPAAHPPSCGADRPLRKGSAWLSSIALASHRALGSRRHGSSLTCHGGQSFAGRQAWPGPASRLAPSPQRLPHQRPRQPAARPAGQATSDASSRGEPVIVHIRDVKSGEMDVFAGTSHARLTDPGMAARLVRGIS